MTSKELIEELREHGWQIVRIRGSHHQLKHPEKELLITVPHPKKDLGIGLVRKIKKDAGL